MSEKRDWIFLRGLMRGRGHWGDFPELFKKQYPNDEIELIDIPGNGERNQELSPWNLREYIPLMRSQSQFLKQNRKVHMLAVSLGGMIAVEWMKQFPQDFEKTFLTVTSSQWSPFYNRFQPHNYSMLVKALWLRTPEKIEQMTLSSIVNSQDRLQAVKPKMIEYSARFPVNPKNLIRQLNAASQVEFPDQAPGNVQLIGSHGDKLVSPACTEAIGKHWGMTPTMHSWAGHDIPIDDPSWLIQQLK